VNATVHGVAAAQQSRGVRAIVAAVVLLVTAACGGGGGGGGDEEDAGATSTTSTAASSPGADGATDGDGEPAGDDAAEGAGDEALEVEVVTETFVDGSRPTEGSAGPSSPNRVIETRITHPTSGGPYPLIVLSHGFTGHPEEYEATTPIWAADGFVVVQPTFPLTNRDAPGVQENITDVVEQPGDVSFVIDEVLAATDDPASPLHGLVDPEAIGVVGHSLGGATTWAVSFDTATRDERIDSTVVFAGLTMGMPGGELAPDPGHPLLVLHGDADDLPIEMERPAWEQAAGPKWFVTLHGAEHRIAFTDEESPYDDLVTRTVLAFWHGTLDGDADALDRVTAEATDPELSTVEHVEE
jgi:dienelactone hydrolase